MVTTASKSANNEDVSCEEPSAEEPSDNVSSEVTLYAPAEEVHEVVKETISAEPHEESGEPESLPSSSDDTDDGFVMVNSRDDGFVMAKASTDLESANNEIVSPELPAKGLDDNVSSEALEPDVVHEVVERTTRTEPENGSTEPEHVSAPDHVEDKSINRGELRRYKWAVTVLPSESVEDEVISCELPTEVSADKEDAPIEEIGEIEDAATHAKPDEVSVSLESAAAPSDDAHSIPKDVEPKVSALEMVEESIAPRSTPLHIEDKKPNIEHEHEQSEVSHKGSEEIEFAPIGVDTVSDSNEIDSAEHTSEESLGGATSDGLSRLLTVEVNRLVDTAILQSEIGVDALEDVKVVSEDKSLK